MIHCMRFNINKNLFTGIVIIINNVEIETLSKKSRIICAFTIIQNRKFYVRQKSEDKFF